MLLKIKLVKVKEEHSKLLDKRVSQDVTDFLQKLIINPFQLLLMPPTGHLTDQEFSVTALPALITLSS